MNSKEIQEALASDNLSQEEIKKAYDETRETIINLQKTGLIAARGTVIEKYSVTRPTGTYEYYRLCDSKGKFLIHLGNADSEWHVLFRRAIDRRNLITELRQLKKLLKEKLIPLDWLQLKEPQILSPD